MDFREMGSIFKIWYRLLLVIILCGCVGSFEQEDAVIREAARLMQEQPDSALRVLGNVSRHSLRGDTLARYALIHSIAQDKSGQDVTNDSLLRIAYGYYSRHPEDSLYARSQYYMGKYLCLTEQPDSAYGCLLRAKTASVSDSDYYTAYLATDRMRRIAEISDTALCLSLSKEAYRLYLKHGAANPANEAYLLRGIGDSFHRCHESDSTLYYYNRALGKARLAGDSTAIASVFYKISLHYWHYKQYVKAFEYAQQALRYKGYLDLSLLKLLALCYIENSEYEKARQYIDAMPSAESKETRLVKLRMQKYVSYFRNRYQDENTYKSHKKDSNPNYQWDWSGLIGSMNFKRY